jgi:(4S)-4-hydroxy-5-phosphonooxypentane-2,3-dione isomerase
LAYARHPDQKTRATIVPSDTSNQRFFFSRQLEFRPVVPGQTLARGAERLANKSKSRPSLSAFSRQPADYSSGMLVVHVHVKVKPDYIDSFRKATIANAQSSRKEPGIAHFDVLQQPDEPTRFVLVEAYRTAKAPAAHKETLHYQTWRDTVAEMMAEPRQSVKFTNVDPPDALFEGR